MRLWVEALLDPTPIEKGTKDKHNAHIQMPPTFDFSNVSPSVTLPPASALRSTRACSSRSVSPSKVATPGRKIATPRKSSRTAAAQRAARSELAAMTQSLESVGSATPSALQAAVENGTTVAESLVSESVNGDVKDSETMRIEVQETVEQDGDVETTTTNVKIDVPASHPELLEPEDPTEMIEKAKRMVQEAHELQGGVSSSGKSKRKAEDEIEGRSLERPAKLARTMSTTEQKLAKEKVTRRALVGLSVMAAIGYVCSSVHLRHYR
jgi:hypothetical protein